MAKKKKPPTEKELRKAAGVVAEGIHAQSEKLICPGVLSIEEDGKPGPFMQYSINNTISPFPELQIYYRRFKGEPVLAISRAPGIPPYVLHPGKKITLEFHVQK